MDKTTALATQILAGVGGEGNILKLENCMTRVRVEVSDEQRLDLAALKQLPGVKGYIKQGEQHQFIVGPGAAAKVVDAMRGLLSGNAQPAAAVGDAARTKAQAKQKYAAPMSGALKKLADVFIPLIPAFIASGLITGIINLLKRPDIAGQLAVDYPNVLGLLAIFGSAVFAIMNILVGVNAARVFGGSQAMGGVMAGILSSPALAQITLFGEALQPGRGGVIAVLLVVALMCWVEKRLRTLLPESVELILNPLLTTLVTASLAILILQPVGGGYFRCHRPRRQSGDRQGRAACRGAALGAVPAAGALRPASGAGADPRRAGAGARFQPAAADPGDGRRRSGGGGAGGAVENPQCAAEEGDQRGVAGRHSRHRRAADLRGDAAAGAAVYRRLPRRCGRRRADQLLEGGDGHHLRHFGAAFGVDHRLR